MQDLDEKRTFLRRGRLLCPIANCSKILKQFGTGLYREISLKAVFFLLKCPAVQILLPYKHLQQQKRRT